MLRITERQETGGRRRFEAQGRLVGPWVAELRRIATEARSDGHGAAIDVSAICFADCAGVRLLRDLAGIGVLIEGVTPYIAELLDQQGGAAP